jgi:hypothetical protein
MNASVKATMTAVRTIRYAILPERRFSWALDISVLVEPVVGRRRGAPAALEALGLAALSTAISSLPQARRSRVTHKKPPENSASTSMRITPRADALL